MGRVRGQGDGDWGALKMMGKVAREGRGLVKVGRGWKCFRKGKGKIMGTGD